MDTVADATSLAGDLYALESRFVGGMDIAIESVESLLSRVRRLKDDGLIGRVGCLLSRVQSVYGQHERALVTATDALRAFETLDAREAHAACAFHAETLRAAGAALSKLGRLAEALPRLEESVRIAESGLGEPLRPTAYPSVVSVHSTLIRCLVTLGVALFAIREIDPAIELYYRAIAIADSAPAGHDDLFEDVMLARANLTDALHERVRRRRAAGEHDFAQADIEAARRLLDASDPGTPALSGFGRSAYLAALGQHQCIIGQPREAIATFERQLATITSLESSEDWALADAHANLAQAFMELDVPRTALEHATLALDSLNRHDESNLRASVLAVQARALRAIGQHAAAYDALVEHHALRSRLAADAAQQYASHMIAQLGLERARADAESHRRIAAMLETLGQIGQELTANLDADTIFSIFAQHVGSLLDASALTVWLLDPGAQRLRLAFGLDGNAAIAATDILVDDTRSLAAQAVRERREIVSNDAGANTRVVRLLDGTRPMQSALFVPLVVSDRVLGVVSIQSECANAYDESARSIFRTLSTYAAIALDNAAAYTKLEETVLALVETQSELAEQTAEFERLSMTDALTGVANRRHLYERARAEIATMRRKRGQLAVVMFDIDHFKAVNDTYGHALGDAVLRRIASVAKDWLRPADLIARIGGEEFALLLPGVGRPEATVIAERIRSSIAAAQIDGDGATVRVTASFGVATFDVETETLEPALSRADAALYAAKQAGRDRVHVA